jgi:hypothetical protein
VGEFHKKLDGESSGGEEEEEGVVRKKLEEFESLEDE